MADLWHYTRDGAAAGPVSAMELQRMARAGLLLPTDLVWQEGMRDWALARKIDGLFPGERPEWLAPEALMPTLSPPAADQPPPEMPYGGRRFSNRPAESDDGSRYALQKPGMSSGTVVAIVLAVSVLVIAVIIGAVFVIESAWQRQHENVQRKNAANALKQIALVPPPARPGDRPINGPMQVAHPPALGEPRAVPVEGLTISDRLTDLDPPDALCPDVTCKVYAVRLEAGRTYTIDMMSAEFDPFLRLENAEFVELASDDDSGGDLNARIDFTPRETGVYRVIATSFDNDGGGAFTLRIREDRK